MRWESFSNHVLNSIREANNVGEVGFKARDVAKHFHKFLGYLKSTLEPCKQGRGEGVGGVKGLGHCGLARASDSEEGATIFSSLARVPPNKYGGSN